VIIYVDVSVRVHLCLCIDTYNKCPHGHKCMYIPYVCISVCVLLQSRGLFTHTNFPVVILASSFARLPPVHRPVSPHERGSTHQVRHEDLASGRRGFRGHPGQRGGPRLRALRHPRALQPVGPGTGHRAAPHTVGPKGHVEARKPLAYSHNRLLGGLEHLDGLRSHLLVPPAVGHKYRCIGRGW
jgi:hypothetical protein